MITIQHLLAAYEQEIRILHHLGTKVTAQNKDFQFSESQRTTEQLQQYIVGSLPAQVKLIAHGGRDQTIYETYVATYDSFTYEQFADALATAYTDIQNTIKTLEEKQWHEDVSMRGMQGPRIKFLNDYVLVFLGAYKMQLFLQLKAAGCHELNTYNLRAGIDAPAAE